MMKYLYSLIIVALLLQFSRISLQGASAQESRDGLRAPADQILYVSPGGGGSCTASWANACELQTALATAVSGDEVWVQAGTYQPTTASDRTATFTLKSGVSLYGGFNGTESLREQRDWVTQVTTLSGEIGAAGSASDDSYHVVTGSGVDSTALLDGFTVTGGNANGTEPHNRGGGMYNDGGSPSIANTIFSSNTAIYGGGMFNENNSSPSLVNVTFSGNTAIVIGGGVYNYESSNPTLANVILAGNTAIDGGGMSNYQSNPTLTDVTFSGNAATNWGGGMYNSGNSRPTLARVTFSGNTAGANGGGIGNDYSSPTLARVTLTGNTATMDGGGMYNGNGSNTTLASVTFSGNTAEYGGGMLNSGSNPRLTNVTFSGNAADNGGGMYNQNSSPHLANVTFSGNTATQSGGGMYNNGGNATLANTIVWGNTPVANQINNATSTPVVTYSDVQGGYAGTGNINLDPFFERNPAPGADGDWGTGDDDYGDLRLQLTSPAIDAGDNSAVPSGVLSDLGGYSRFIDMASLPDTGFGPPPIVDMGAYEAQHAVYLPVMQR